MAIVIYTDGSCLRNPNGPGGFAFCLTEPDGTSWTGAGNDPSSTNNRMELVAVIEALKNVPVAHACSVHTDSNWVIGCATGKMSRKANLDLWTEYDAVAAGVDTVTFVKVKAHSGDVLNELVDKLAREAAHELEIEI